MKSRIKSASLRVTPIPTRATTLLWLAASVSLGTASPALLAQDPKELTTGGISPVSPISPDRISILEQPRSQALKEGQTAILKVNAFTEKGDLRFQWLKDGTPIQGANSSALVLSNVSTQDQGKYWVSIQNQTQKVLSEPAGLSVESASNDGPISIDKISILEQPRSQALKEGQTAILKVNAFTEKGDLRFQWLKDGTPIQGANSSALVLSNVSTQDQGKYWVSIQNQTQKVLSEPAGLSVESASNDGPISIDKISILEQPRSQALKEGQTAILKVNAFAERGDLRFQWLRDGRPIPGANSSALVLANVSTKDQGIYSVSVENQSQKVLSQPARLSVEAKSDPSPGKEKPDDKPTPGGTTPGGTTPGGTTPGGTTPGGTAPGAGTLPAKGTYQGLLARRDSGSTEELPLHAGRITVSVTVKGALSGNLEYAGSSYRFSGKLDSTSRLLRTFVLDAQDPLELSICWDAANSEMTAAVQGGRFGKDEVSDASLELSDFNPKTRPAPQAGKYTLALRSPLNPEQIRGFACANVSAAGAVIFVGKSGDGTPISTSANLLSSGEVAFYVPLKGLAQLCGPVAFDNKEGVVLSNGANGGVQGELELATLPQSTASGVNQGSVETLEAEGSVYEEPKSPLQTLVLKQPKSALTLNVHDSGDKKAEPLLTQQLTLGARNQLKVAGANSEGLNLGLNSKMGAIRGSFFDANGVKRNLEGVYLRSSGLFEGIWVANGASGGWSLSQPASSKP